MKKVRENTEELQNAIFEILKRWDANDRGYWNGYGQLYDQLYDEYGFDVKNEKLIKKALQSLKAEGKVITQPLFNDNGLLNGTGWFFNYYKLKNELANENFYKYRGFGGYYE